ncbi:hypothetical protein K788_0005070 (plasmid) [Paraburkholderia caribensis MBA4]|uniref:Uncharacterized protein n=1 Tax=Paraburkholderia caribensis MBA4 TaxID=1323664 RepID=A0A0P0RKY8_9BURK|nr:hypothetical protein K788_0005070 [Paraburkholderia caribensis MBA4]
MLQASPFGCFGVFAGIRDSFCLLQASPLALAFALASAIR